MNTREILIEKLKVDVDTATINLSDRIINQKLYGLDFKQQTFLEKKINSKESHLLNLAQEVFKNPQLIEQSEEFKNVRKFMQKLWRGGEWPKYSNEELDYIFENGASMTPHDIAGTLFPDEPAVKSIRPISYLLQAAGITQGKNEEKDIKVTTRYNPPKTDIQVVNLINKSDFSAKYDYNNLDQKKKDCVAAVKKFLAAPRFVETITALTNLRHREVFETEFVKVIYNKPDLIPDETNLYLQLALEYVNLLEIREHISNLNDRLKESTSDDDEGRKFTITLTEALKDKTTAYNQCLDRTIKMTKSLSGDRIKKLEKQVESNNSLTNFVELVKEEKERKRLMLLARAAEFKVKERIEELDNFPDLFVEVFGLGKDEVFNI